MTRNSKGTQKFHLPILFLLCTCFSCVCVCVSFAHCPCVCVFLLIFLGPCIRSSVSVCVFAFFLCCYFSFMLLLPLCESVICLDLFWFKLLSFLCWVCAIGFLISFCLFRLFPSLSLCTYPSLLVSVVPSLSLQCFLNVYSPKISLRKQLAKTQHGAHLFLLTAQKGKTCSSIVSSLLPLFLGRFFSL